MYFYSTKPVTEWLTLRATQIKLKLYNFYIKIKFKMRTTISHINDKQDWQSAYKHNIEARSLNHYCPLKT